MNAVIKTAGQEGMRVGNNVKLRRKTDNTYADDCENVAKDLILSFLVVRAKRTSQLVT